MKNHFKRFIIFQNVDKTTFLLSKMLTHDDCLKKQDYIPDIKQLLDKENHKFQYKEVEKGGRAQKYYSGIDWLLRADIVRLCKNVSDVKYDLDDHAKEDFFRVYTSDLSLLIAMRDFYLKQHIVENTLSGTTKGGIYECVIADILIKKDLDIYFYKDQSKKREIDFLIQK